MTNTGALQLLTGNGTATQTTSTDAMVWDADNWYNIAVTFKNTGDEAEVKIFINGELQGSGLYRDFGDMANNSTRWKIGQRTTSSYGSAPGLYDNFRISSIAYDYAPIPESGSVTLVLVLAAVSGIVWKRRRLVR